MLTLHCYFGIDFAQKENGETAKRLEQLQKRNQASIRIQGYIRGYLVRRREELKK